jgi:hypothetical protein
MSETLEVIDLDSLISDEPGCEAVHKKVPCSVEVAERLIWCRGASNVCANAAGHIRKRMERGELCSGCYRAGSRCWRVWPI